jgi:hypothetical protein
MNKESNKTVDHGLEKDKQADKKSKYPRDSVAETGGFDGPEPTRYGDWEKNGRCIDF